MINLNNTFEVDIIFEKVVNRHVSLPTGAFDECPTILVASTRCAERSNVAVELTSLATESDTSTHIVANDYFAGDAELMRCVFLFCKLASYHAPLVSNLAGENEHKYLCMP